MNSPKECDVNKLMGEAVTKPKTFSICIGSRIEHENDKGRVVSVACAGENGLCTTREDGHCGRGAGIRSR